MTDIAYQDYKSDVGKLQRRIRELETELLEAREWELIEARRHEREAIEAYELAVRADPSLADAHFNVAGLYERLGERASA